MAADDKKVSALDAITTLSDDDLFHVVDDPSGTPADKKLTWSSFKTAITNLFSSLNTIYLGEQASASADISGKGQFWIRS